MQSARSHPRGQDDFRGPGQPRAKVPGISYTGSASPGVMNGGARGQVRRRRGHRLKAKGLNQLARGFLTDLVISYQFLTTSCVSGTRGLNLPSQSVLIETPGVRQHYPMLPVGELRLRMAG